MKSGKPKSVKMAQAAPMKGAGKVPKAARPSRGHAWGEGKGGGGKMC